MDAIEVKRLQRKLERARECDKLKEAFEICMEFGAYFATYEKYEDALDKYREALSISEEKCWNAEAAVSQRMIAETCCSLGEYQEAVKHAQFYLDYSKKGGNKIEEQRGYATKGRIYFCWAEFLINEKSKCRQKIKKLLKESLTAYKRSLNICDSELNEVDDKEKQEMKARLFQNLGLVMGSLGNYKQANLHFTTAIQINKSQNFKENLYWCYINQGEYYLRAKEYASACTYFDLAVKATTSSENTNEALKLKAKSYLRMGNLSMAKSILRQVHKKQHGKDEEVVSQLKVVVYLCKLEKMIDSTPSNDHKSKKELFERKGDAFCALKQYGQGVEAYLKMLENAEMCSNSNEDLLPCYSSLAQTYKDNEQYNCALFYCQKELELLREKSVEASKTYLFLAELYELLNYDFETVVGTYKKAQQIAQEVGDRAQEMTVLRNMIEMQKDHGCVSLANDNEKLLRKLQIEFGDSAVTDDDDNEAEVNSTENFICDINDEELFSDVEDDKPRHQVRRNAYKVKRNKKGETELHVAAINGNYSKVKSLIEMGHPVNEKDLAGWTVLHEACNHGHIQIVELLLNAGADINNPGGAECGGITPLHDAAENGHCAVVQLLLDRGACPAILTNDGDTPLDCLKRWQSRTTLTDDESQSFRKLCTSLKTNLDSFDSKQTRRHDAVDLASSKKISKEIQSRRSPVGVEDEIRPTSSRYQNPKLASATKLYISAIDGLRRKPSTKFAKKKVSPLINEEDLNDDLDEGEWLEDDMGTSRQPVKRRKVLTGERRQSPVKQSEFRDYDLSDEDIEMISDDAPISDILNEDSVREGCSSPVFNVTRIKPTAPNEQTAEPTVEQTLKETVDQNLEETVQSTVQPIVQQTEENRLESATSKDHSQETGQTLLENHSKIDKLPPGTTLYKFKVQVLGDLFMIPVLKARLNELTVEWLAKETEERYRQLNGTKPVLMLMTEDDAIVSKDDPVALLINENIKARVLEWKEITLADKYVEHSARYRKETKLTEKGKKADLSIMNALDMFSKSGDLILIESNLEAREVMIVLDVLAREKHDVKLLDLSRNYLRDDGLEPLLKFLEIQSVERLHLRANGISAEGIEYFCQRLSYIPEANLSKIIDIDFSYNILRDESADYLNIIIEKLQNLERLCTENCAITKKLNSLKKKNEGDMSEADAVASTVAV